MRISALRSRPNSLMRRAQGQTLVLVDRADITATPRVCCSRFIPRSGPNSSRTCPRRPFGDRPEDGVVAAHRLGSLHDSTGFEGPRAHCRLSPRTRPRSPGGRRTKSGSMGSDCQRYGDLTIAPFAGSPTTDAQPSERLVPGDGRAPLKRKVPATLTLVLIHDEQAPGVE